MTRSAVFLAICAILLVPRPSIGQTSTAISKAAVRSSQDIYTWAENTPAWNQRLHITGYRIGCAAGEAESCFKEGLQMAQKAHINKIIVSMELDSSRAANDALTYSQLSLSHPSLIEVTFDDFVDRYGLLLNKDNAPPPSWLSTVIQNVKGKNPSLQFGITLYEDEMDSPYLKPPYLLSSVARSIDDVHLYIHYRTHAPDIPLYVQKAKSIFPNAHIIVGSYAYDRLNYIPCEPSVSQPCSAAQEIQLYKQSIAIEAKLLKQGQVAGIEFYPGFFGMEKQWQGWRHPDYCDHDRLQQCVDDTLEMRQVAAETLRTTMGW
jgi:hypothetical protein